MSGRVGRSRRGIATAALSLLIVAGLATAALADGGPDRVLPRDQQVTQTVRPGFGDQIQPARPGFGDHIMPAAPANSEGQPSTTSSQPAGDSDFLPLIALVIFGSTALAAGAAWYEVSRRRRLRMA